MKRIFVLLSCLFSFACTSKAITPSQFTEEFAKDLRLAAPSNKVIVKSDLELQLINSAGKESTAFLDNAYKAYLQDPRALRKVLQLYIASYLEPRDNEDKVDRARIVPIIKDKHWLTDVAKSMKERGSKKPMENVFEEYNEDLTIVYAEDSPKNIRYLTPKKLDDIGVTRAELRSMAVKNLRNLLPNIEIRKGPLISMVTAGGDYEACLLLLDDIWAGGAFQVRGDIVVAIPSREILLVTGSEMPDGIAKLRELANKFVQQSSYRLTDTLFVYRNGRFTRFEDP
jgi:uncharacterized protein YtpQ (UPF0354 family)